MYLEYGSIRYGHLVYFCGDGNVCSGQLNTRRSHFFTSMLLYHGEKGQKQCQYNAQSLNPVTVAHNLMKAVDKHSHCVQNLVGVVSLSVFRGNFVFAKKSLRFSVRFSEV